MNESVCVCLNVCMYVCECVCSGEYVYVCNPEQSMHALRKTERMKMKRAHDKTGPRMWGRLTSMLAENLLDSFGTDPRVTIGHDQDRILVHL